MLLLETVLLDRMPEIVPLLIGGCSILLIMFFYFIGFYFNTYIFVASPIIICLLVGSVMFWVLRNKAWLTPEIFIFILPGGYLIVNIVSWVILVVMMQQIN
jgi:hypothetical protein